jgi:hypothetical protein
MKGDFSRVTFDPRRHYNRVLTQQGRVSLDADHNEATDIAAHLDETTRLDVIGISGAPYHFEGPDHGDGFALVPKSQNATDPVPANQMVVSRGRYYVQGLLVENDTNLTLANQIKDPYPNGRYIAYLDVWERLISAVEDPALREVALGGPDTSVRVKTEWRVRLMATDGGKRCVDLPGSWSPDPRELPTLSVKTTPFDPGSDPCDVPVSGGYTGLENQLYRVEIQAVGADPRFKWSRDNASLAARLELVDVTAKVLVLSTLGRDPARSLDNAPWLELLSEADVLAGRAGLLISKFEKIADDRIVLKDPAISGAQLTALDNTLKSGGSVIVRAWDGVEAAKPGKEISLENGLKVLFKEVDFRVGDYWQFSARNIGNQVLAWPKGLYLPPHGERHRYAILALLDRSKSNSGSNWRLVSDCRRRFRPLSESIRLAYVGGDGQEAMPGRPLFQPLTVAVVNGQWPVENATVRFKVLRGGGSIIGADVNGQMKTDANGLAMVTATLSDNLADETCVVEARLLDGSMQPVDAPVRFNLNQSKASLVQYNPGSCQALKGQGTVQGAIERLSALRRLTYVGGDGQVILYQAGTVQPLPQPLQVKVVSLCGPLKAQVRFSTTNGLLATQADFSSDRADRQIAVSDPGQGGLASVYWQPDSSPGSQTVIASLVDAEGVEEPQSFTFTAQIVDAHDVAYATQCIYLNTSKSVAETLDLLCPKEHLYPVSGNSQEALANGSLPLPLVVRVLAGGSFPAKNVAVSWNVDGGEGQVIPIGNPFTDENGYARAIWTLGPANQTQSVTAAAVGETITFSSRRPQSGGRRGFQLEEFRTVAIRLPGRSRPLQNNERISISELSNGLQFDFTMPIDQDCLKGNQVGRIVGLIPAGADGASCFAWTGSEQDGYAVTFPWHIQGTFSGDSNKIIWRPTKAAQAWLEQVQGNINQNFPSGVEVVITLNGWAIWSIAPDGARMHLEGRTLGLPGPQGMTQLDFGNVAGEVGSSFETSLWLVA